MSCYHPLRGIKTLNTSGIVIDDRKPKCKVNVLKGEYDPENIPPLDINQEYIPIPCGKCIGCRLDYSRHWAERCMLEASYHENNMFLTLTYDDNYLPPCKEGSKIHSLRKRDIQLFMKRLRKKFPDQKIRFYACGEYGTSSMRPHYHLILFGLKLDEFEFLKRKNGFTYYTSRQLADLWPFGFHSFTDVSFDTCSYVARYVMKKQKGPSRSVYDDLNYEPEFTLMSRKPGIGKQFYDDHNDIVVKPYYIPTREGHKTVRSNRYFDKLFDIDYPNDLDIIKEDRMLSALHNQWLESSQSSLSYNDQLRANEVNKLAQIRSLSRKEV